MSKVLLVEDDNNLRDIYEAGLQAEGYDIASAKDGEEALVVAKTEKPDLVISDVMMPKISGFEMLDILRNTPELKDTKVIMLTALGQAEDQSRANHLGADRYLVKSQVTLEDIVKVSHELLGDEQSTEDSQATTPQSEIMPTAVTTAVVNEAPAPAPEPVAQPQLAPAPVDPTPAPQAPLEPVATAAPVAVTPPSIPTPPIAPPSVPTPNEPSQSTPAPEPVAQPQLAPAPVDPTPAPQAPIEHEAAAAPEAVEADTSEVSTAATPTPLQQETPTPAQDQSSPTVEAPSDPQPSDPASTEIKVDENGIMMQAVSEDDETKEMDNTINQFLNNLTPNSTPDASGTNTASNDQLLDNAVDSLSATTPPPSQTPQAPSQLIEPAPSMPTPSSEPINTPPVVDAPAPAEATTTGGDGQTIAGKKVIKPIDNQPTKSLEQLIAEEAAKESGEVTNPPSHFDPSDPNSIAL